METMHLEEGQLRELRSLGIPILVPGSLPPELTQVHVTVEDASYRAVFHASPQRWVAVQGASSGLGDVMPGARVERFQSRDAGAGEIEFYAPDSEEPTDFRTSWLQPTFQGPAYSLSGQGLEPAEVLQVATSLRWLE